MLSSVSYSQIIKPIISHECIKTWGIHQVYA